MEGIIREALMVSEGVPEGPHCRGDKQASGSSVQGKEEAASSEIGGMQNNGVRSPGLDREK